MPCHPWFHGESGEDVGLGIKVRGWWSILAGVTQCETARIKENIVMGTFVHWMLWIEPETQPMSVKPKERAAKELNAKTQSWVETQMGIHSYPLRQEEKTNKSTVCQCWWKAHKVKTNEQWFRHCRSYQYLSLMSEARGAQKTYWRDEKGEMSRRWSHLNSLRCCYKDREMRGRLMGMMGTHLLFIWRGNVFKLREGLA